MAQVYKFSEIPTKNKLQIIDNYSPNYNYIVEGDKVYYSLKGKDYWVDISDNGTARKNLLTFLKDKYNFKGYEDNEPELLTWINSGKDIDSFNRQYSKSEVKEKAAQNETQNKQEKINYLRTLSPNYSFGIYPVNINQSGWSVLASQPIFSTSTKKEANKKQSNLVTSLLQKSDNQDLKALGEQYNEEGLSAIYATAKSYFQRWADKHVRNDESIASIKIPENIIENSEYGIVPNSYTGDTIPYKKGVLPREYYIPESINVTDYKFGARNRNDYSNLNTDGAIITTFDNFEKYDPHKINPNGTYIGVDSQGRLKVGKGVDFEQGDILTGSYSNTVYSFAKDENGNYKFQNDSKHGNRGFNVAALNVLDEKTGEIKEGYPLNILVGKNDNKGDTYGSVTGGRVLVKVGNETRLLSGSLKQIEQEFEAMKKRQHVDHGTFYTLDNGTFNKGLRTYDKTLTSSDLRNYDKKNSSGGNFLYLLGKTPNKFEQDTVLSPNIRTTDSESYKKGHPLINSNKGVVLHYTAFDNNNALNDVTNYFLNPKTEASAHVLILPNGKRRMFANEDAVTFHAGESRFNDVDNVNDFMHGIEFQAPGPDAALTNQQVESAVEYLERLIKKYNIPLEAITTHQQVRKNYIEQYPNKRVKPKQDLSKNQYNQIMSALKEKVYYKK